MVRWFVDYDYPSFLKAPRIYAVGRFLTVHLRTPAQPYARPFEHLERLGRIAATVLQLIVQYPHISLLQVQATVCCCRARVCPFLIRLPSAHLASPPPIRPPVKLFSP